MIDSVTIRNIQKISELNVSFDFTDSNLIVITGKNGVGKTTLVKSLKVPDDPTIFKVTTSYKPINENSEILFKLEGGSSFTYSFNSEQNALDTKDKLPAKGSIFAELPIPSGNRFKHFSDISGKNSDISARNAAKDYSAATELIDFLKRVYSTNKFNNLKAVRLNKTEFYFIPEEGGFYLREDHFSSGEYFLIQIFRLITSGAKLTIIDELDVAIDAAAQVKLFNALKPILKKYETKLVVISHSLAFMSTVDDGALYYLEEDGVNVSLEQRSFGYIKSDLFGFKGYERYILTEDPILEGFIEYIIKSYSVTPYYQHQTIGVAGVNQLQSIIEKNDVEQIFSGSECVICIVDGDVYGQISRAYKGTTLIFGSPVEDIERYIFLNRIFLLPDIKPPAYPESEKTKKASKAYWKYLVKDQGKTPNELYKLVVDTQKEKTDKLVQKIKSFLEKG